MNKLPAHKEELIDRMMCAAYSVRVICEVAKVSRNSVLVRRAPMVYGRGFWFVNCPCGKAVIDPDTDHFHDQEPCKRRSRRNRLLLRLIRRKRSGQERTLSDVAGNVPASKPYDPSIKPATGGSNACGEGNIAECDKISTATGSMT